MTLLGPGDPLPWLSCRLIHGGAYPLSGAAGRPVVLTFVGSAANPAAREVLDGFAALDEVLDGERGLHLVVSCDPADEQQGRLAARPPGRLVLMDLDRRLARALGVLREAPGQPPTLRATTFVLDVDLRVLATLEVEGGAAHADRVRAALPTGSPWTGPPTMGGFAPVLILPRVLASDLCRRLVDTYDAGAAEPTGVVLNHPDGRTELVVDPHFKVRRDLTLRDRGLVTAVHERIQRRVVPELARAFQFKAAHVERFMVACYEAGEGGWFGPHRDNQGPATAHRRFALTMGLNAEEYEGGDLSFPEYGPRRYRVPTGGAAAFSCSLLHMVHPVTRGRRLVVVPFLYDVAGMKQREASYGPRR